MSFVVRGIVITSGSLVGPSWRGRSRGRDVTDPQQRRVERWSDEHYEPLAEIERGDRIVECMHHVCGVDPVLVGALGDDRLRLHYSKLLCRSTDCKLTCRLDADCTRRLALPRYPDPRVLRRIADRPSAGRGDPERGCLRFVVVCRSVTRG
nr:hypothetical protein PDK3.068 [Rhodococcus sp. DK17]